MVKLKIKRLREDAITPKYAHLGDAGLDLFCLEDYTLQPRERKGFNLGFATEFEEGYVALIWDKSGLAAEHGIKTMGGVIDHGYRGEWKILLLNTSETPYEFKKGDKIAQALIQKVESPEIIEVESVEDSSRGEDGFGSTGR